MARPVRADDLPTLRLVTLRRLVRGTIPPIVFDQATHVSDVELALQQTPEAVAIFIDESSVLQGTLSLAELRAFDRDAPAERVMSRRAPVVEGENDVQAARLAMSNSATDRCVVIDPSGQLLGVLTGIDLDRSGSRAA